MNEVFHINWIARRMDCFLPEVFKQLQVIVEKDVDEANSRSPAKNNGYTFSLNVAREHQEFSVIRTHSGIHGPNSSQELHFTLNKTSIRVGLLSDPENVFYVKSEWIRTENRCVLTIEKDSVDIWQISKKALEPLVFDDLAA